MINQSAKTGRRQLLTLDTDMVLGGIVRGGELKEGLPEFSAFVSDGLNPALEGWPEDGKLKEPPPPPLPGATDG